MASFDVDLLNVSFTTWHYEDELLGFSVAVIHMVLLSMLCTIISAFIPDSQLTLNCYCVHWVSLSLT